MSLLPATRLTVRFVYLLLAIAAIGSPARADKLFLAWESSGDVSTMVWYDTETSTSNTTVVSNQQGYMRGISVDPAGRVYWSGDPVILDGYIRSANHNGSDVQTVATVPTGNAWVGPVTVDATHGYLYYAAAIRLTDQWYGVVRTGLDGSNPLVITDTVTNRPVYDLAVDEAAGQVYMAYDGHSIYRCNLDGSGRQTVLTGLSNLRQLELDPAQGLMYLGGYPYISVAPMDGSVAPVTILDIHPRCMALSPTGSHLYFGEAYSPICRVKVDGTDMTEITRVYDPVALDVIPEPATLALLALGGLAVIRQKSKT